MSLTALELDVSAVRALDRLSRGLLSADNEDDVSHGFNYTRCIVESADKTEPVCTSSEPAYDLAVCGETLDHLASLYCNVSYEFAEYLILEQEEYQFERLLHEFTSNNNQTECLQSTSPPLLSACNASLLSFEAGNCEDQLTSFTQRLCSYQADLYTLQLSSSAHDEQYHHHSTAHYTVFTLFMMMLVGAGTRYILQRLTPIPYTVLLLIIGMVVGVVGTVNEVVLSYLSISEIDPHLLLYVFLPLLIFESSFNLDYHVFKKSFLAILILAVPGVLVSTTLQGIVAVYIFPHVGLDIAWTWPQGLLFGSILAATDPVAVVSLLRELGAKKTLATLIEGESLINDGTAIVVFLVLLNIAVETNAASAAASMDAGLVIGRFFYVAGIGPIVGWIVGKVCVYILKVVYNDHLVEATVCLFAPYLTFYIAEEFLEASGVLAVVFCGLYMNVWGRTSISHEVEHFIHTFYEMMGYVANTIIFLLAGVIIGIRTAQVVTASDFGVLAVCYVFIHLIRGFVITFFSPLLRRTGYGLSFHEGSVVCWGGLRGAVSLALGLVVDGSIDQNTDPETAIFASKLLFLVAGIVVCTLVINGSTVQYVVAYFGMTRKSHAHVLQLRSAHLHLEQQTSKKVTALQQDQFLSDANWNQVCTWTKYKNEDPEMSPKDVQRDKSQTQHARGRTLVRTATMVNKSLVHARIRFLKVNKQCYWQQFGDGLIGQDAILALNEVTSAALDNVDNEHKLRVTPAEIEALMRVPQLLSWFFELTHNVPLAGDYFRGLIYEHLQYAYTLGVAYIRAQQAVQRLILSSSHSKNRKNEFGSPEQKLLKLSLVTDNETAAIIRRESVENQRAVLTLLNTYREAYPEISSAIKTSLAAHNILKHQLHVIKGLVRKGALGENDACTMIEHVEERQKRLTVQAPQVKTYKARKLVETVPWIKDSQLDIDELMGHVEEVTLSLNKTLFREDDACDGVYLIARGVARVQRHGKVLALVGPGGMFGELGLLTNGTRTADVECETYLVALRIEGDYLMSLMSTNFELYENLWHVASGKFAVSLLRRVVPFKNWSEEVLANWVREGEFEQHDVTHEKLFEQFLVVVITGDVCSHIDEHAVTTASCENMMQQEHKLSFGSAQKNSAMTLNIPQPTSPEIVVEQQLPSDAEDIELDEVKKMDEVKTVEDRSNPFLDGRNRSKSMQDPAQYSFSGVSELVRSSVAKADINGAFDHPVMFLGPCTLNITAGTKLFLFPNLPPTVELERMQYDRNLANIRKKGRSGKTKLRSPRKKHGVGGPSGAPGGHHGMHLHEVTNSKEYARTFINVRDDSKTDLEHVEHPESDHEDHPQTFVENMLSPGHSAKMSKQNWNIINNSNMAKRVQQRRSSLIVAEAHGRANDGDPNSDIIRSQLGSLAVEADDHSLILASPPLAAFSLAKPADGRESLPASPRGRLVAATTVLSED